jgi:hypothetical protein
LDIPGNKKVVCITGSVWTGSASAPRHLLVKDGFVRPTWFTTGRPLTDAHYRQISVTGFHMANADREVLAHIEYGGSFVGVMLDDFESALAAAERGVLIVGPPELAAGLAERIPKTTIFSLKEADTDLSGHLDEARKRGQVHRVDVDVLAPGAWEAIYRSIANVIGLPAADGPA